jgi:hypothetical protein
LKYDNDNTLRKVSFNKYGRECSLFAEQWNRYHAISTSIYCSKKEGARQDAPKDPATAL